MRQSTCRGNGSRYIRLYLGIGQNTACQATCSVVTSPNRTSPHLIDKPPLHCDMTSPQPTDILLQKMVRFKTFDPRLRVDNRVWPRRGCRHAVTVSSHTDSHVIAPSLKSWYVVSFLMSFFFLT